MPEWIDTPQELLTILTIAATVLTGISWVIRSQVKSMMNELTPNHGSSLRDAVDRIERKLDNHIDWHMDQ